MATTTYEPIQSYTLGSNTDITFTSIPQTYTDLVLILQGNRTTASNTYVQMGNGSIDTGSNYSLTYLRGNGSSASSGRNSNLSNGIYIDQGPNNAVDQVQIVHFQNYSNTNTYKTILARSNQTTTETSATVGLWRSTSAINTIKIWTAGSGTLSSGFTATLYGIANAAIGAPKATGGIITYDNTYYYHTFGASGTFTPQQSLTCDFLVIAGGGGAGSYNGGGGTGGGGAGGLRSSVVATGGGGTLESPLSLSATAYTVTVGAGGPGASGYNVGTQGGTSSISTITTVGGGRSTADQDGGLGGSGGGGYGYPGTYVGGAGTANQGYAGGNGTTDGATWTTAGGGGGAGAVGGNGNTTKAGDGGAGVSIPVIANTTGTGVATYYAGGGGGAGSGGKLGAAGGLGGGGTGGNSGSGGTNGVANTGSGGGGNGGAGTSGNGGSGVVIIRYLKA